MISPSIRKRWGGRLAVVGATLLATAVLPAAVAFAQSPPDPPARFVGQVSQSGTAAPNGTAVEARVGTNTCGSSTVFVQGGQSRYALDVTAASGKAGCGTDGAAITFFVAGVQAGSGTWKNFQLNQLDLAAGAATPPPAAATPTPVKTPVAPQTGTGLQNGGGSGMDMLGIGLVGAALIVLAGSTTLAVRGRR